MRIALVSCLKLDQPDFDFEPLARALSDRGHQASNAAWDDPDVDWAGFDAALLRSTWDYHQRREEFLDWCEAASKLTRLWNPPDQVRWSTHKFYLRELEQKGIPIIPTLFLEQGSACDLARALEEKCWESAVVKPAVSADSFGTVKVDRGHESEAQRHLDRFLSQRDMLVQKYLSTVVEPGERCHVAIDSTHSHAIRKRSLWLGGRHTGPEGLAVASEADEREAVARVLRALPFPERPLYARVDLLRDELGVPRLMELELVEPSLFFELGPGSAALLAEATLKRIAS